MYSLISVIIPVYNVEPYLDRCLASVLNNTYKNLEVICINDGSTDNSLDVLRKYERTDERVVVLSQMNGGVSKARNRGLEIASGDYIAFVDPDDWVHKRFFETLLYFCNTNHTEMAACSFRETQLQNCEDEEIELNTLENWIISKDNVVLDGNTRSGYIWNCLFRKDCLEGITFQNLEIEDIPFKITVFAKGEGKIKISYIDCELYYYFQRADSCVRFRNAGSKLEVFKYLLELSEKEENEASKRIYLLYLSKTFLLYRYGMMYEFTKPLKKDVNSTAKKCASSLYKSSCGISLKYRMIHSFLLRHEGLYRLFRIIDDPTMLKYEKQMKLGVTQTWNRFKTQ